MAKAAAAVEAPPDEETFEVELGEGEAPLRLDTVETEETESEDPEKTVEKPKPAPKAAKPKEKQPEAEPEPEEKQEPLSPAAREERNKRKLYARKWQEATEERDAAIAELERLRRRPGTTKEQRETILKRAEEADSMRSLMEMAVDEMDRRDVAHREEIFALAYQHKCDLSELSARTRHDGRDGLPTYDEAMQKSGIYDAVQIDPATGTWRNPDVGRRIYMTRDGKLRSDPAEIAYQLAIGKIESENPEPEEPAEPAKPKQPARAAVPEPKPDKIEEARREGAREVVERVAANVNRPKGISNLPNAGPPTSARLTRRQLDEILDKDPARYERMVAKDPSLKRWHLGGF